MRDGRRGPQGEQGDVGPIPEHQWDGTRIRFQKQNGKFGDWIELEGKAGATGERGPQGEKGDKGDRGERGPQGEKGDKGDRGERGFKGEQGAQGEDGLSAYEVWLSLGNTGDEDDFFQWLADKIRDKVRQQSSGAGSLRLKLSQLKDVNLTGLVNGDTIVWNASLQLWVPGSAGSAAETFESVSKNLKSYPYSLNYDSDGQIYSIEYDTGTGQIIKTFGYTADKLTSITLSGDTPSGIDLIKTLSYSGDNLISITYS